MRGPLCRACVDEAIDARRGPGAAARGRALAAAMGVFVDGCPPEMPMAEKARRWQAYLATAEGRLLLPPATFPRAEPGGRLQSR